LEDCWVGFSEGLEEAVVVCSVGLEAAAVSAD
jgi:hypothetical protein